MTDKAKELERLAKHVEGLPGACRETDAEIYIAVHKGRGEGVDREHYHMPSISHGFKPGAFEVRSISGISLRTSPKFTASRDASASLMPEGWAISNMTIYADNSSKLTAYEQILEDDDWDLPDLLKVYASAKTEYNARTAAALRAIAEGLNNG